MRDLAGRAVILTRTAPDNARLAAALDELGAAVIELPCIDIQPVADDRDLMQTLRTLRTCDRLVVTSRAGARAVAVALHGEPLRAPLAVVGPATERAARDLGLAPDFTPSRADTETLGHELPVPQGMIVLARSDRAAPGLVARLRERGAQVRNVVAYRTSVAPAAVNAAAARMACERGAVAVLASPSAVEGFAHLVGTAGARCVLVAIGPATAARIRQVWRREPIVAARPADDAILETIRYSFPAVPV
ncbi:MAG: uroporphyrinogen-III synthase [Candidatus Limnocylindria bacterium]